MPLVRALAAAAVLLVVPQGASGERVDRLLAKHECQTRLPNEEAGVGSGAAGGTRTGRGERSGAPGRSRGSSWSVGMPLPPVIAKILLWTVVAVAVGLLIAAIVRGRFGARAPVRPPVVRGASPTVEVAPTAALADHEQLASAGDFAAAVRAVLQHAFAAWVGRGGQLPTAATAREVLGLVRARRIHADPLSALIGAVERAHFGGRGADLATYESTRIWLRQWEEACAAKK